MISGNTALRTGRKLNVHKTFRRRPGRFLNVLCTFNLRPVSKGTFENIAVYNSKYTYSIYIYVYIPPFKTLITFCSLWLSWTYFARFFKWCKWVYLLVRNFLKLKLLQASNIFEHILALWELFALGILVKYLLKVILWFIFGFSILLQRLY